MKPDAYLCESCVKWDDVNGCWNDCKSFLGKNCVSPELEEECGEEEKEYE